MIKKGLTSFAILLLYMVSLLPFWFLYLIADALYIVIYYLIGYRRKVVNENLHNSFPEKTGAEIRQIEKRFYRYFADLIMETVKCFTLSEAETKRRMLLPNVDQLTNYFNDGRNIVAAVGHYGNWEFAALRAGLITSNPAVVVYKPLHNQQFDNAFKKMRSRFGALLVPMKSTLRKMVELRQQLSLSIFVSDQTPIQEEAKVFLPFLNQQTAVFLGIEKIAKLTNAVVVFADIKRIKRGFYECNFSLLADQPGQTLDNEITALHVKYLEQMINRDPANWLWTHRRWKFKPKTV